MKRPWEFGVFERCRFAKGEDTSSRGFEIPAALDVDAMPGNLAFLKKQVIVKDQGKNEKCREMVGHWRGWNTYVYIYTLYIAF